MGLYLHQGWLYLRKRNLYQSGRHYGEATRIGPAFLFAVLGRLRTKANKRLFGNRRHAQP